MNNELKYCPKCKEKKSLDQFYKCFKSKDGHFHWCKDCRKLYDKEHGKYYRKTLAWKEQYERNIEIYKRSGKKAEYERKKKLLNINFKISQLLRSRILKVLHNQKTTKSVALLSLLGCSIEQLRQYLEQQFKEGMTWQNHGKVWHIDHYIPCSYFDLSDLKQQKICFNWRNLQPLWWDENIRKSNKVPKNVCELINNIKINLAA